MLKCYKSTIYTCTILIYTYGRKSATALIQEYKNVLQTARQWHSKTTDRVTFETNSLYYASLKQTDNIYALMI